MTISNPKGKKLFKVKGSGPYKALGMTELFFEGAEPSLSEVDLEDLLAMFPAGTYDFHGLTVDHEGIGGEGELSYSIDGPAVSAAVSAPDSLVISWTPVTAPPPGFPDEPIDVVAYQVIVELFQVTVPASVSSVTVSPEFVAALPPGEHLYEVLAIEASGNQTLTEGAFVK
jgi:hypothetical protein